MFLKHKKMHVLMILPSLCFAQTVVDQFESNIMITVKSALQRLIISHHSQDKLYIKCRTLTLEMFGVNEYRVMTPGTARRQSLLLNRMYND